MQSHSVDRNRTCLAVDLGASSGRVMAGWLDSNRRIVLDEVRRFNNDPVERAGTLCWNYEFLIAEIFAGLKEGVAAASKAGRPVVSIGVDSWAVDFGLVDGRGELTGPVVHYRDARTHGMMETVFEQIPQREIFARTGIQFLPFNTIYQLAALRERDPGQIDRARHFMMIADIIAWQLTGEVSCEYTNATTTQLFDAREKVWSAEIIRRLGLPAEIFPPVTHPGNVIGKLRPELARDWKADDVRVIAVASHDTGSAVAAVPAEPGKPFAYLSCGTWSLLGTELHAPVISEEALVANFTNEGGAAGTIRFLKNIMGLWILQECRRQWAREGREYMWPELEAMAREADAAAQELGGVVPLIDVDEPGFLPPGNMPARVLACAAAMGAEIVESDHGAIVACILRSLASRYKDVLEKIEELTVVRFDCLYVIGGGVQNRLLLEWTAEAIGREVKSGPAEATALGNIGLQMIAAGELRDLADLRVAACKAR